MGEIKPSYDTNRQILGEIYPIATPFNVIIDSSELCNFKCNYCFRNDENKDHWGYAKMANIMEWEVFEKVVEQIKMFPQEVKQISLSNHGEPLTNRNIPKMVRYLKSNNIKSKIAIHTNAALLNEEYVRELAESDIDRIVVSLQGLTSQKYKETCGTQIDYDSFYQNLKLLYEIKKDTNIQIKIANIALDKGEEDIFYQMYRPISDTAFVETIVPIWKNVDVKGASDNGQNKYGEKLQLQQCCPLIFHTIVVAPNGDVYPCTQLLMDQIIGNVLVDNLVDIWNGDARKKLLVQQCKLEPASICQGCYIKQNCICTKEDMIDEYRFDILKRIEG